MNSPGSSTVAHSALTDAAITPRWAALADSAASRAAPGSSATRRSARARMSAGPASSEYRQRSTSGSSRFHDSRGRTRVPALVRLSSSPLPASTLTPSRSAERPTSNRLTSSSSVGTGLPGPSSPRTMAAPSACTTWACRAWPG